jgi:hypothetical protein
MNRTRIILATFAVTFVACAVVYFSRHRRIADMEVAIAEKRTVLAKLDASETTPDRERPERTDPASSPAAGRLSVAQAAEQALAIGAAHGGRKPSGIDYLKAMDELLAQIADFNVDELLAVADAMDAPLTGEKLGLPSRMKQGLLLLVAEHDPELLLARPETSQNNKLASTALAALAKRDSAAVLRWMESVAAEDFHGSDPEKIVRYAVQSVFREDFREGLRVAGELGLSGNELDALNMGLPLEQRVIDQAAVALDDPANSTHREAILGMILNSAAFYSGVPGMEEICASHHIPDAEVAAYLTSSRGQRSLADLDPAQAIPWMETILTEEQKRISIPELVRSWANRDFNAAGTYLGKMPPSETRDLSVAKFAAAVTTLDPSAAAHWALQISDPSRRQTILTEVIKQWNRTEPEAAQSWLQQNGQTAPEGASGTLKR